MMRKILLSVVSAVLGTVCSVAQDTSVLWGIKASLDAEIPSKWHLNGSKVSMYRPGLGFTIGSICNIYLDKNFYFEPGISLAYTQYKYKDVVFSDSEGLILETDPKIFKWSFQIPLVVGYSIDISDKNILNVFTGPQVRYAFAGKIAFKNKEIASEGGEFVNLWNGQRRFDLSWKLGVGIPINDFLISLEADLGITDLFKNDISFRENRVGMGVTYYF